VINNKMKNSHLPKISIVTPSYNQAEFIEKTILSVLGQEYPNLEYIIIDGGSTDGSVDIIKKYENRITYWVSEPDEGQAHAIRKGFGKCTGDILAWLNSDDVYIPGAFIEVAERFKKGDCDFVYGDELMIDSDDKVIGERPQLPFPGKLGLPFFIYGGFWIYQPASFWTRDLYERSGGIDKSYRFTMDPDLFIRFAMMNAKFEYIKVPVINFRLHESSKTCTIQEVRVKERNELIDKYKGNVPGCFRSKLIMKSLGKLYFFRHLFCGNFSYFFDELLCKLGLKKKHPLMPY